MKRIIINSILAASLAFSLGSCDDSAFLTENPETFYTVDNAFSTSEQVDQVLVGCYSHVRVMMCMIEESVVSFAFRGGNGTDMYDVATIRRSNKFNDYSVLNASNTVFYTNYSHWYQLIAKANLAIYAAELPQISWASAESKAYALAQARFFRAFCYRNLGELYGGVPIVTEITTTPRYDFKRSTRVETYQYAIDEMEAILNDLPETTSSAGRLVKGAAQHNLCQLYIDKGVALEEESKASEAQTAYQKAISYGDALIDGSVYQLMTERFGSRKNENPDFYYANTEAEQTADRLYSVAGHTIQGNVYWDLFQEGNQNYQEGNKEAIWCAQIDYEAYKTEDNQSMLQYSRVFGAVFRDPMSAHLGGALEDVGGRGIVQVMPTMYTRDIIYEGKWNDDMRNSEAVFRRLFLGNVKTSEYYGKIVPWSVIYRDGQGTDAVDAAKTQCFPISCKIATDKYTGIADGQNRSNLFRDEYLIRLPETILLRAEAKMRSGNKEGAANDINLLRKRAKCSYLVTASDVSVDLILDERARELVYEECRWNTLLRMGGTVAVDRIKKYAYWDDPRATLTKNFNLWPIPQVVIDTNKDVPMVQNPGWN
ncbi:RagB/SusD family nutrient uptake outer membrane protein [Parabacteroides sp. Marseille-P3160]|uniref:RagB/SusD family nutrient uptake outer membrane protein n=1 Tax=Parabacteroides sp. Marseille-P3160 TaxID=1917887 RepID=UPI0009BBBD0D|nr:RagB/SusD family nutrient uptake outer membrane protein [Parabacteroides sp. Marseille-P3160]